MASRRIGTTDYRAALPTASRLGSRLAGKPVVAAWDAGLAPAMEGAGLALAEESLVASLLTDLQHRMPGPAG